MEASRLFRGRNRRSVASVRCIATGEDSDALTTTACSLRPAEIMARAERSV
jgi:hypothetical protein